MRVRQKKITKFDDLNELLKNNAGLVPFVVVSNTVSVTGVVKH